MRQSMRFRFLQQGKNLLPLNTWKTFEKVCNGVTGPQMIEQTLNRYPGPSKNRLPSKNFRVSGDDVSHERQYNACYNHSPAPMEVVTNLAARTGFEPVSSP